jgi:hypothetical protein
METFFKKSNTRKFSFSASNAKYEPQHFFLNGYFQHEQEICNFEHKYFCDMGIEMIPFERDVKNYEQLIGSSSRQLLTTSINCS